MFSTWPRVLRSAGARPTLHMDVILPCVSYFNGAPKLLNDPFSQTHSGVLQPSSGQDLIYTQTRVSDQICKRCGCIYG